tara:strand:+ start:212 stop:313 length:102 start_codon:yes stop_codon:yes gene_type:complete
MENMKPSLSEVDQTGWAFLLDDKSAVLDGSALR